MSLGYQDLEQSYKTLEQEYRKITKLHFEATCKRQHEKAAEFIFRMSKISREMVILNRELYFMSRAA